MVLITIVRWAYVHQLSYLGGTTLYGMSSMLQPKFPAFPRWMLTTNLANWCSQPRFDWRLALKSIGDQETSEIFQEDIVVISVNQ